MIYPSVSIVIPVYNVEAYIEDCIRSVMRQTYNGPLECIFVDDCGTDNSILVVQRVVSEYVGPISFKTIHHTWNRGLSAARNTGIDAANGNFIFFLDGDDALLPESLEILVRPVIEDPTVEMVVGNREKISAGWQATPETIKLCEIDLNSIEKVRDYYFSKWLPLSAWNRLIRTDFVRKNRLYFKEGLLYEDQLWIHYVMKHLNHLYLIPDVTYVYYKHPQSITTGTCAGESARHKGIIFEEIAMNLTRGEEAREAAHIFQEFSSLFFHYPLIPSFQKAAPLFKQALSDGRHYKERFILSSIIVLSKTILGRWLISAALALRTLISAHQAPTLTWQRCK